MKPLSETYKELGIAFTFPIEIYDAKGNRTYYENSDGFWQRWERNANGKLAYYEDSDGELARYEYDANGKVTHHGDSEGTVVEIDGIKFNLKAL